MKIQQSTLFEKKLIKKMVKGLLKLSFAYLRQHVMH